MLSCGRVSKVFSSDMQSHHLPYAFYSISKVECNCLYCDEVLFMHMYSHKSPRIMKLRQPSQPEPRWLSHKVFWLFQSPHFFFLQNRWTSVQRLWNLWSTILMLVQCTTYNRNFGQIIQFKFIQFTMLRTYLTLLRAQCTPSRRTHVHTL